jgi:hypothetical protein
MVADFIVAVRDRGIVGRELRGALVRGVVVERALDTAAIQDRVLATGDVIGDRRRLV